MHTPYIFDTFISYFCRESLLDPERGYRGNRVEGLDFYIEHMTWKRLPKELFEPLGGAVVAKALRLERGYGVAKAPKPTETDTAAVEANQSSAESVAALADSVKSESGQSTASNAVSDSSSNGGLNSQINISQYDLGKKWFASDAYEGFGATGVDTIEKSRKKLRAEAFGGEANLESVFGKRATLYKDLPVILPKNRLFGNRNGVRKYTAVPNVTWSLLDGK